MPKTKPRFKKERPPDQMSTDVDWRLFVAVPMPAEAVELVDRIVGELSMNDWPVRWVAPDTVHLTLHFIGDVSPERAQLLRLALTPVIARHESFTIKTGNLGVFPDVQRPRVIWLGLEGQTQRLTTLHAAIAATLHSLDLPVESRELRPHLTLGRVRDNPPTGFPVNLRRRLEDPRMRELVSESAVRFSVNEVQLVRSFLGKGGARHESLARFPLVTTADQEQ